VKRKEGKSRKHWTW